MKKIPFGNVRDFCSPVANLLGDVLVKKSVAVLQRRTEFFLLSQAHISPKIIVACPWLWRILPAKMENWAS